MDYVILFNELTKVIKIVGGDSCKAESVDDNIVDIGLDSLDIVMLGMYIGELYGIDEEVSRDMPVGTIKETFAFAEANKTTEPKSIEEAIETIQ